MGWVIADWEQAPPGTLILRAAIDSRDWVTVERTAEGWLATRYEPRRVTSHGYVTTTVTGFGDTPAQALLSLGLGHLWPSV